MEYNFYKLPKQDIIFLFNNLESVTPTTKAQLLFRRDNILSLIQNNLSEAEYESIDKASLSLSLEDKFLALPKIDKISLLYSLIPMRAESKEDLVNILQSFRKCVLEIAPKDSHDLYAAFYKNILKDKMAVFSILQKALPDDIIDPLLGASINTIYSLWLSLTNAHVTAIATGMLYTSLEIDDESLLHFLVHSVQVLTDFDEVEIMHIFSQLNEQGLINVDIPEGYSTDIDFDEVEIMHIFSQLNEQGLINVDIPEGYSTDIDFDEVDDNEELNIIGDDLFSDRPQFIHDLKNEIMKLDPDSIKRYIGSYDNISYRIDDQSIGYLMTNEDYEVAKVIIRDKGLFTIVKYEGTLYLLFELGKDTIQGISFPVEAGGERKVLAIKKDNNVYYTIKNVEI